jgi:branched-chain amino acid transport system permease protein
MAVQSAKRLRRTSMAANPVRGRTRPRLLRLLIVAGAVELVVPELLSSPNLLTANLACTYAIAAIGLSIVFTLGGLVSVAQAAIMAVGGYAFILLFGDSVGLVVGLALATLAGAAASALTGAIGARVKSHYFILVSLAIAQIVTIVITNASNVTGGANGTALKAPATFAGFQLSLPQDYFAVAVVLMFLAVYVADSLRASRSGLALRARVLDEYLTLASGISIGRYRILGTAVGGALAGLAGAMLAISDSYLGPQNFGLDIAILLLLMVVIAGTGRSGSVVIAALILTFLSQGLLTLTGAGKLIYGVGLVLLIMFAPESLGAVAGRLPHTLRRLPGRASARARAGGTA